MSVSVFYCFISDSVSMCPLIFSFGQSVNLVYFLKESALRFIDYIVFFASISLISALFWSTVVCPFTV